MLGMGRRKNAAPPWWCATTIPDDSQAQALLKTFCRMDRNSIVCFGVFFQCRLWWRISGDNSTANESSSYNQMEDVNKDKKMSN